MRATARSQFYLPTFKIVAPPLTAYTLHYRYIYFERY